MANDASGKDGRIVDLNVGGTLFSTGRDVLSKEPQSLLHDWFAEGVEEGVTKDLYGRYFIDRDGQLFRYVLDYLRTDTLVLPDAFKERQRLLCEAQYYRLRRMTEILLHGNALDVERSQSAGAATAGQRGGRGSSGYITIGYQGTFSFGPQGLPAADVNFRKINRILVSGKVSVCREVFGETLNEGRDPDRGHQNDRDRYTARYYLKHNLLEYAFDMLSENGYKLLTSCASGTSGMTTDPKPGSNTEEDRWAHYNEFIFYRQL